MNVETLLLGNGRALAYTEFGDPGGWPLLYFHGFPACRLEACLADGAARALGIRLIAPDRPGFGGSEFQSGRGIMDWPADVAALADKLGLGRFALVGVSGGGPYALVCARFLGQRVTRAGVVCGVAPPAALDSTRGINRAMRVLMHTARLPLPARRVLFGALAGSLLRRWPERVLESYAARVNQVDREVLGREEVRRVLAASLREAFVQGGMGAAWELGLYTRPWGFSLADVPGKVLLWHGERDDMLPPRFGRYVAVAVPRCEARFVAGEGHFSLPVNHMAPILSALREP